MAKAPTESELKYRLMPAEYRRLRARFRGAPTAELRNVYFDDAKRSLRRKGMGLRIRFTRGKAPVMTLKAPAPGAKRGGGYKVRREYEAKVPAAAAKAVARGTKDVAALNVLPSRTLRRLLPGALVVPLGAMKMRRTKIPYEGLTLELDRFEVRGRRFHELEVETKDPREASRIVRALLRELKIPVRPHALSKLGQFFILIQGSVDVRGAHAAR